jgi:ribosomal protein S18 acetylase RimI-like enzyme
MEDCKILTPNDGIIVPNYVELFNEVLDEISPFYDKTSIQDARDKYTREYIVAHLSPNKDKRFVGHFNNQNLDGLLVEGFKSDTPNRTEINWVMASQKGMGIGTTLIQDCINRARAEAQDMVVLGVSTKNIQARKLYEKLGFVSGGKYKGGTMEVMGHPIN